MKTVRFIQNFVMTIVTTSVGDDGQMNVSESLKHIQMGDIYPVDNWEISGNSVTLHFPSNGPISGVAMNIDIGFIEFQGNPVATVNVPGQAPASSSGCGCGK